MLDISSNKLRSGGAITLAVAIKGHPSLRTLCAKKCAFGAKGMSVLVPVLGAPLERVNLADNEDWSQNWNDRESPDILNLALEGELLLASGLREICLDGNIRYLNAKGAAAIAASSVQVLHLGNCLDKEGYVAFVEGLRSNRTLREIYFNSPANPALHILFLEAITGNNTLRVVIISDEIAPTEETSLALALLVTDTSLEVLGVNIMHGRWSMEEDIDYESLIAAFSGNKSIRRLWLGQNAVGPRAVSYLSRIFRTNAALHTIQGYPHESFSHT